MSLLQLSVGGWDYDRVQALRDGRVAVDGADVRFITLPIEELFYRLFHNREFDVCEMSLSAYMMAIENGPWDYVAIPVFLSRMFRHSAIYIRADRGIREPADLRGKRIGVPEYTQTAGITARGMLEDDYGVSPRDITWVNGGLEELGRHEKFPLDIPGVTIASATHKSLSQMLLDGELDGLISAAAPSCYDSRGGGVVTRLFPGYRDDERAYYARTTIFPIMHTVGIRRRLVEENPWLPLNVTKAYQRAKQLAMADIYGAGGVSKATVPWLSADVEEARSLMGTDWWPYGLEANRTALLAAARWSFAQGLTRRLMTPDELFAPTTLRESKV